MAGSVVGIGLQQIPTSSMLTPAGVPNPAVTPQQQQSSVNDNIAGLMIDPVVSASLTTDISLLPVSSHSDVMCIQHQESLVGNVTPGQNPSMAMPASSAASMMMTAIFSDTPVMQRQQTTLSNTAHGQIVGMSTSSSPVTNISNAW
jgi:inorganic pyrophosphatase/exopolyphosphatase